MVMFNQTATAKPPQCQCKYSIGVGFHPGITCAEQPGMSITDNEIDPPDDELECTWDMYTCRCKACLQEWIDTYADAKCEEMKDQL